MGLEQSIDCPDCGTPIPIETWGLLEGRSFACPGCGAKIAKAGAGDAGRDALERTFAALKAQMEKDGEAKT